MMIFPSLLGLEEQTDPIKTGLSNTTVNGQLNEDKAALATTDDPLGKRSSRNCTSHSYRSRQTATTSHGLGQLPNHITFWCSHMQAACPWANHFSCLTSEWGLLDSSRVAQSLPSRMTHEKGVLQATCEGMLHTVSSLRHKAH